MLPLGNLKHSRRESASPSPRKGNTEPRVFTPPLRPLEPRSPETEARTLGYSVIDFAEQILGIDLYPYQRWLVVHGLELKPEGGFRFRTLVVLIARQNGKSTLGQILALWALYVLRVPLIIGTAQDLATAEDLWEDVVDIAQNNADLDALIKSVNRRNGARSLELKLGTEYKVKASTRKAARGLSSDLLLLDELREHTNWDAWGAVTKTMMARPKAQAWALSNAGDELSVVLMSLRKKAHAALGDPDGINKDAALEDDAPETADQSLGIFEWSAAPGRSKWDREGWAEANPAMGYGALTEEALASACATDPDPVFRTECLCQWILGTLEGPFPGGSWERCADLTGVIENPVDVSYCVDVSVDRSTAWVAVCGSQASGRPQVEIAAGRPGGGWLKWVPEWFESIADPSRPVRVVVPARAMNPAAALLEPLNDLDGVEVVEWAGPDMPLACGLIYDRVVGVLEDAPPFPPLAHRGQEALNLAAATAAQRVSGDGWYWDRRNSAQDASPLVAVTGALWDHLRTPEEPPKPSIYSMGVLELI